MILTIPHRCSTHNTIALKRVGACRSAQKTKPAFWKPVLLFWRRPRLPAAVVYLWCGRNQPHRLPVFDLFL